MLRRQGSVYDQLWRKQACLIRHPDRQRYQLRHHDPVLHFGGQSGRLFQLQQMGLDLRNSRLLGITIRLDGHHRRQSMEVWGCRLSSWLHFLRYHVGLLCVYIPAIGP